MSVPPAALEPGEGIELVLCETDEQRDDFLMVNAEGWGLEGFPYELACQMLFEPKMLDDPLGRVVAALAYLDGEPVRPAWRSCTRTMSRRLLGRDPKFARRRGLAR